jgi:hypothetical protein
MPEYWVSHKRKNVDGARIEKVKAMSKKPEGGLNPGEIYTRNQVVKSIEDTTKKNRWITCKFSKKEGDTNYWTPGEEIHVYRTENDAFIRTDRNETEEDNLGDLPDF